MRLHVHVGVREEYLLEDFKNKTLATLLSFLRKHTHLQFYSVFRYWADKTQRRSAA